MWYVNNLIMSNYTVIFVDRMLSNWDMHTFVNISDPLAEHARFVVNVVCTTKKMRKKVPSFIAVVDVSY